MCLKLGPSVLGQNSGRATGTGSKVGGCCRRQVVVTVTVGSLGYWVSILFKAFHGTAGYFGPARSLSSHCVPHLPLLVCVAFQNKHEAAN